MAKKGVFVAFRWHPDNEQEREAMAIRDSLLKDNFTDRQIFCDAMLRLKGRKPEMFQDYSKQVTKPYIEALLADFASHLLSEMRGLAIAPAQSEGNNETPLTEDEDTEFAKNIAASYLARRKR